LLDKETREEAINWDIFLLPYKQAVGEMMVKLNALADGFHHFSESFETSPIESVEGRVKAVPDIIDKAKRKGVTELTVENIVKVVEDIAGIRIICRFVDDIKRVVNLIRERDGLDIEITRETDYVKNMKPSGYRSYHIIIKYPMITALGKKSVLCEIQIRTLAMNFWAVTEHSLRYKYKNQNGIPTDVQMRLIRSAEAAFRLDNEISEIRDDILEAERQIKLNYS